MSLLSIGFMIGGAGLVGLVPDDVVATGGVHTCGMWGSGSLCHARCGLMLGVMSLVLVVMILPVSATKCSPHSSSLVLGSLRHSQQHMNQ